MPDLLKMQGMDHLLSVSLSLSSQLSPPKMRQDPLQDRFIQSQFHRHSNVQIYFGSFHSTERWEGGNGKSETLNFACENCLSEMGRAE